MDGFFRDGEPYEVERLSEKIDLGVLLNVNSVEEILEFDLDCKNFVMPKSFSGEFERKLEGFSRKKSRGTENRLKFGQLVFLLLDCLSEGGLKSWVFEVFVRFSKDEYFSIRKVCALNIGRYLEMMPESFHNSFIEIFSRFMVDKNVLVVQAAYSSLGLLMYSLENLNEKVLHWAEMLSCSDLSQAGDLAYYLPAIFRKFPSDRPSIFSIWKSLLSNPQSQVRSRTSSTLSFFLQNSSPATCTSLTSTYQNLLKDTDIVKIEAISHLGSLLEKIPESLQSQFLGTYRRIQTYNLNWRVNLKIAKSLIKIAKNLKIEYWMQELWQVSLALCQDKYEVVRVKSSKAVGKILKDLWNVRQDWNELILKDLQIFLEGRFKMRQALVYICAACEEILWFRKTLEVLAEDSVVDVRVAVSVVACKKKIQWLIEKLQNDESGCVKMMIGKKFMHWKNESFSFGVCRGVQIELEEFEEVFRDEE